MPRRARVDVVSALINNVVSVAGDAVEVLGRFEMVLVELSRFVDVLRSTRVPEVYSRRKCRGGKCYVYDVARFCLPGEPIYMCKSFHVTWLTRENRELARYLNLLGEFLRDFLSFCRLARDLLERLDEVEKALRSLDVETLMRSGVVD